MVTLELKQLRLRDGRVFDYRTQLLGIIRNTLPIDDNGQKRGFVYGDMKDEAEPLARKIEEANGAVEMTAAEVVYLAAKVERSEWPFSDPGVIQFVEDIRELRNQ